MWIGSEHLADTVSDISKWTLVDDEDGQTHRLKVPGGFLYRVVVGGGGMNVALAFVPERRRGPRRDLKGKTSGLRPPHPTEKRQFPFRVARPRRDDENRAMADTCPFTRRRFI